MKNYLGVILVALVAGAAGAGIINYFDQDEFYHIQEPLRYQLTTTSTGATVVETPDFISASAQATPAVVHIKSYFESSGTSGEYDPFKEFFKDQFKWENRMPSKQAAGSGVIISTDGYIVTNNHVINEADRVEVVLNNKKSYIAEVVGTDPTTDLALLKIEEARLPTLGFGDSDEAKVGEWVLAVGNPFNLTSTVTAGIISAKGRSLNILNETYRIESFIQTDAAVNPGNSGGALINNQGELIGINTAIASETGSFAGYSFAVPSNIVKKVMEDLKEYGKVQRGIIGVQIQDINAEFAENNDLDVLNGAFVSRVVPGGAAERAGIENGDIITAVNGKPITSSSELQEIVGTYRPGDEVAVTVVRDNSPLEVNVVLRNIGGSTALIEPVSKETETVLGADLRSLTSREKARMGIDKGVKVEKIDEGLFGFAGIEEGFVITKFNRKAVDNPGAIEQLLDEAESRILIEGIGTDGTREFYSFNK